MDKMLAWWYDHDPREQMMMAIGGTVAVIVLFVLFIIIPVMDWHAQEKKRLQQAKDDLSEVKLLVSRIQAKQKTGGNAANKNLAVLIDQSIRKNELTMRGFQPGPKKDARLRLENAPYPALAQWLYDLEYDHKVIIEDLSLTPSSLAGRLMVSVRVSE